MHAKKRTYTNSVDPDEAPQNAASHLALGNGRSFTILSKLDLERLILVLCTHFVHITSRIHQNCEGAQWLSGRVLNWRPRGRGFEPHRRHCVVVLEQDTFILA